VVPPIYTRRICAGAEVSMLVGNLVSILSGGAITIAMSVISGRDQPADSIWENTRDIDNPLRPWSDFYVR